MDCCPARVALAFIDDDFLRRRDLRDELVGELDRREFVVLARLDQNRTADAVDVRVQREFLPERIELIFVVVAPPCT
jgi:hypothetical protein